MHLLYCVLSLTCTYAQTFKFWISWDHTLSWWCPNNSISFSFYFLKYLNLLESHFGKLQSKDMLQHLWTGPISNAAVDVVQGDRSVEVRSVGVTKVYTTGWAAVHHVPPLWPFQIDLFIFPMDISIYIQGAAIDRILGEIVRNKGMKSPIDYVLCAGHFLSKVCFPTHNLWAGFTLPNVLIFEKW